MQRNQYTWMGKPRLRGYRHTKRSHCNTEFDRWMRVVDMNSREVAEVLDIPEDRIADLRSGWRGGRLNGGIVPSFITRYAMAAVLEGLQPAPVSAECYDMVVRLGQAAHDAGLTPWPAGELLRKMPRPDAAGEFPNEESEVKRAPKPPAEKRPGPRIKWSAGGKRILTPKA